MPRAAGAAAGPGSRAFQLHDGREYPALGLGGCGPRRPHVSAALQLGYRLLDTASAYQWGYQEHEAGEAVKEWDGQRESLWVQTKVHPEDLGTEPTWASYNRSVARLGRVDSLLIHKPHCFPGACAKQAAGDWRQTWRVFEELYRRGAVRAIGICDVHPQLLAQLLEFAEVKPHVIQNYMDPYHQDADMRRLCAEHGIVYQSYSTLGTQWLHFRTPGWNPILADPVLAGIAERHSTSVASVVLAWALQEGVAVVPASRKEAHIAANLALADAEHPALHLDDAELAEIAALDGTQPQRHARGEM